jgi:hypothetical protein
MGQLFHILRRNEASVMPHHLLFYDCETRAVELGPTSEKHLLRLGVVNRWRKATKRDRELNHTFTFRSAFDFWEYVESCTRPGTKLILLAHNQHFDFTAVNGFQELASRGWSMQRPVLSSGLFIVSFVRDQAKIQVLDLGNWFPFPLWMLGKRIGLHKLEIDFDTCTEKELELYCRRDVDILQRTFLNWLQFLDSNDLGNFRNTISSQAMQAYRHRFMQQELFIHANPDAILLERESYRGGRTECFHIGHVKGPLWYVDFNSLYPSVMQNHLFPRKLVAVERFPTRKGLIRAMDRFLVIARVDIKIKRPAIAYRAKRLVFPVGEFTTTLTTPELQWVLENGRILNVDQYVMFEYAPIFKKYVTEVFKLRRGFQRDEDVVGDFMAKQLLTSLYGKFGQKEQIMRKVGNAPPEMVEVRSAYNVDDHQRFELVTFGGSCYMKMPGEKESRHSFPAISSFVTAYARMKLWRAMEQAGRENVFYCDTDSLFVNEEGFNNLENLIHPSKLGHLKVKGESDGMFIFGAQDYEFGSKSVIKGIRKDAIELKPGFFRQARFLKFRSLLRRGSLDAPIVEMRTKHLRRRYRKGVVHRDGSVTPFVMPVERPSPFYS